MGDTDLQAAMTGLQEVLPILEQAQHLLRDVGAQRKGAESKGYSNIWSDKAKARWPLPFTLYLRFGRAPAFLNARLGPDDCSHD